MTDFFNRLVAFWSVNAPLEPARHRLPDVWSKRQGCSCGRQTSQSPGLAWPEIRSFVTCESAALQIWRRHNPVDTSTHYSILNTLTVIFHWIHSESLKMEVLIHDQTVPVGGKETYFTGWTYTFTDTRSSLVTFLHPEPESSRETLKQPVLSKLGLYLNHLSEKRDDADHDEEHADPINLFPLSHGICYSKGLRTRKRRSVKSNICTCKEIKTFNLIFTVWPKRPCYSESRTWASPPGSDWTAGHKQGWRLR